MTNRTLSCRMRRLSERGGGTIVLALVLLVIMSLAAFGVSRASLRELATSGSVSQGTKAAEAADAGLDWFLVWSDADNASAAASATGNQQLRTRLPQLLDPGYVQTDLVHFQPWDMAFRLTSDPTDAASDMVFDIADASVKQNAASGNEVVQKFDLMVRYLGQHGSDPTGGTDPSMAGRTLKRFQVVSEGSTNVALGGGLFQQFRQRREMTGFRPTSIGN